MRDDRPEAAVAAPAPAPAPESRARARPTQRLHIRRAYNTGAGQTPHHRRTRHFLNVNITVFSRGITVLSGK